MIEPAMFALIRDGQTTLFNDPCGSAFFARNLVWGQEGLEQWLSRREPVDQFDPESQAGAVIDFDAQAILWYTDDGAVEHPRSIQMLDALIAVAWPGFEFLYADGMSDLQIAAGGSICDAEDQALRVREQDGDPLEHRSVTIDEELESAGEIDPDDEDEDERFAWITILDHENLVHHRLLGEVTVDVIRNRDQPLDRLKSLEPHVVPAEINVTEAILFDEPSGEIRVWGGRNVAAISREMTAAWENWQVACVESDGYEEQCRFSGPVGQPMSATRALGSVVPILLMTKRVDPAMMLGEIGKSFKGCMTKVVASVTVLVCLPFAIFALVTGNWKEGGITIGIIVALVVIAFKLIEIKWRRGFAAEMAESQMGVGLSDDKLAPVAGPIDSRERRSRLDQLLRDAGMPSVAEVEPHFESDFPGAS